MARSLHALGASKDTGAAHASTQQVHLMFTMYNSLSTETAFVSRTGQSSRSRRKDGHHLNALSVVKCARSPASIRVAIAKVRIFKMRHLGPSLNSRIVFAEADSAPPTPPNELAEGSGEPAHSKVPNLKGMSSSCDLFPTLELIAKRSTQSYTKSNNTTRLHVSMSDRRHLYLRALTKRLQDTTYGKGGKKRSSGRDS